MNEHNNLRLEIMDHEKNLTIYSNSGTKTKIQDNLEIGFTEVSS